MYHHMALSYAVCFSLRADNESFVGIGGAITRQTQNVNKCAWRSSDVAGVQWPWHLLWRPNVTQALLCCMELNNHVSKSYSSCLATLNCTMCWQGLILLAKYNYRYQCFQSLHGCDPTQLKIVTKADSKPVTDSLKATKSSQELISLFGSEGDCLTLTLLSTEN